HARLDDLDVLVGAIGELDWTFARAQAAERMGATEPAIDPGRTVALRAARHPLLLAQSWKDPSRAVVPMDIELGADRPLLVITRPNARRQPDRAQAPRGAAPHGPGRRPRPRRRGLAPAGLRRRLRDHRRRSVRGREPLDLLGLREAGTRDPRARRPPLA